MNLTHQQIDLIRDQLKAKGLSYDPVETELIDEVASSIEAKMAEGSGFEEAFSSVLETISDSDIQAVQRNVIRTLKRNLSLRNYRNKQSLWLALSLGAWVVLEYLIGLVSGILELGPIYGMLSTVLIIYWTVVTQRRIKTRYLENFGGFRSLFTSGLLINLQAAFVFCILLILFWTYIYPDYYLVFEMEPKQLDAITPNQLLMTTSTSAGFATLFTGTLVSFIAALILKAR